MITASASMLQFSGEDGIESLKKLMNAYQDMVFPDEKQKRENTGAAMEDMFKSMFTEDGKPKPIQMDVGDPVNRDANFDKNLKDLADNKD